MEGIKYLVSFKTKRSACMVRVNGFPIFDNFTFSSGTIAAGDNITSFIEDGKNNVEVLMGALDPDDEDSLYLDSGCELTITRDTINSSEIVTSVKLSVDTNKKIIATSSSNYNGLNHEGHITDEQLPQDDWLHLHRFSRNVEFSGITRWSWVGADKIVPEKDLTIIKAKYQEIWQAIKKRDISLLKRMTSISSEEMGKAEGISPDIVFESYNLPQTVLDNNLEVINLEWDKFKITSYCGGRVFRLTRGIYEYSPLRFKDKSGDIVFSYDPYLSIINGKVVIVR